MKKLITPEVFRIGRSKDTERLYKLEEQRQDIIKKCANEWGNVMNVCGVFSEPVDIEGEFWNRLLPQALFDVLESWQDSSAIEAATAYLKQKGFEVTTK